MFHFRAWFVPGLVALWMVGATHAARPTSTWPQWRGPTRDGVSQGTPWPSSLKGKNLRQLWRVELGPSYSGPIVTADRVFVTETVDRKEEVVRALDRKTGKEIWQARWKGAMTVPFFAMSNGSWIRSTPAYDGDSLFVAGMRDVLVCLDAATGKQRWRVDFVKRYNSTLPAFGFVCSPLVVGDAVYVQAGEAFVKLDKKTGKTLWRTLREPGRYNSAFSSPILTEVGGKKQLVVQTRKKLAGVDPETGKVLWSQGVRAFRGMNILTPTVLGDRIFTSAYGGRTHLFEVKSQDNDWQVKELWSLPVQGNMCSPVIIADHAYLHLRNRRFTCIDLKAGKTCWTTTQRFGKYWSLVTRKDRILALDERGILYLIRANPKKFDLIDQKKISEAPTWAHLGVTDHHLFVRELKALAVYEWRDRSADTPK